MKDFLGDMVTRIKNAQRIKLKETTMARYLPKKYLKILDILYMEGYLRGYTLHYNVSKNQKIYKVLLKYNTYGGVILNNIEYISTPGCRKYMSTKALWQPQSTKGIYILSTSKGFITDSEARRLNVGGEILLSIS